MTPLVTQISWTNEVIENITTVYNENSLDYLYFVTLYNIFNESLEDVSEDVLPNEATGFKESKMWGMLYNFQKDAAFPKQNPPISKRPGLTDLSKAINYNEMISQLVDTQRVGLAAILVGDDKEARYLFNRFGAYENKFHDMTIEEFSLHRTRWNIINIDNAKGLEFSTVIVLSGRMSRNEKYIAYTRALDELFVYSDVIDVTGIEGKPMQAETNKIKENIAPNTSDRQVHVKHISTKNNSGKLYIQTGKVKDVSKQIHANPKVEICAFKNGEWLRVAGELVEDDRREARQSMLDAYPSLQKMYSADDGNTEVFYLKNATATFSSFTYEPEVVKF